MFNPFDLMGKLKEMQAEMERARQRLDEVTITAESGGGLVVVTANGNRKVLKVFVDPVLINGNDKEIMEDLIAAAMNKAMDAAENVAREEIGKVSKDFMPNIPGLDLSKLGR